MRFNVVLSAVVLGLLLCRAGVAEGAGDFTLNPSIAVSEEYNDNIFETRDNKRSDFITRLLPGIAMSYSAYFWDWDLAYNYDYRYYAKNTRNNDNTHNLLGTGHIRLLEDFMFLDLNDTYSRVSLNIARDRTQESLFLDQSDSNTFIASPYFQFHPGPKLTTKTGYRYINVWFKDPSGIDRRDHVGFMETTYELSPKLNLTANYTYTHENSVNPYDRHNPYIGFRYEFKERSFFFGQGGYIWFNSKNGVATNDPFWNVGLTHAFERFSVTLATGVQYPIDPQSGVTRETDYSLAVNKELSRGSIGLNLSYAKYSGDNINIENRYSGGITAGYDLMTKLNGTLSCNVDRYDHRGSNSTTTRFLVNPGLNYSLPKEISLALNYSFIDSSSHGISTDNYHANRVMLEVRKSFGRVVERQPTVVH